MKDPKRPVGKAAEKAEAPKAKKIEPFPEIYEPPPDYRVRPRARSAVKEAKRLPSEQLNRPTRAMLLQEHVRETREEELRAQKLILMKENLRDSQQFREWQRKEHEAEAEQKLREVAETKVALEQQRIQMQEAIARRQLENQRVAEEINKQRQKAKKRQARDEQKQLQKIHVLKAKVQSIKDGYVQAKEEAFQQRKVHAKQLKSEIEKGLDNRHAEEFEDLQRRKEAVAKIRAFEESVRQGGESRGLEGFLSRNKNVELMDLAELDKMYKDMQVEFLVKIERKREEIKHEKAKEKENLAAIQKRLEAERAKKAHIAQLKQQQKAELREMQSTEKRKIDMAKEEETLKKLMEKKAAKAQAAAEARAVESEINQRKLFFNQQKERYERIKNENLQLGNERSSNENQVHNLVAAVSAQEVRLKNLKNLESQKLSEAKRTAQKRTAFDRDTEEARERRERSDAAELEAKREQVHKIREFSKEVHTRLLR